MAVLAVLVDWVRCTRPEHLESTRPPLTSTVRWEKRRPERHRYRSLLQQDFGEMEPQKGQVGDSDLKREEPMVSLMDAKTDLGLSFGPSEAQAGHVHQGSLRPRVGNCLDHSQRALAH